MIDVGDRIRSLLSDRGVSQAELARRLGTTPQNVNSILKQDRPRIDTVEKVAKAIGVEVGELTENKLSVKPFLDTHKDTYIYESNLIPFYDIDFSVIGVDFEKALHKVEPTYYMDAPEFIGCYAFRANTDTMEGIINKGSIIFTRKIQDWVSHLEFGQIYWIVCEDGRKYLKFIKKFKENPDKYFLLQSYNSFYDEFEIPKGSIDSIWLVHGHLSKRI